MRGVCSGCQETKPIIPIPPPPIDGELWTEDELDLYSVVQHTYRGTSVTCAGSGTTPERLVPTLADGVAEAVKMMARGEMSGDEFGEVLNAVENFQGGK